MPYSRTWSRLPETLIFWRVACGSREGHSSGQAHSLRARNLGSSESGIGATSTSSVSTFT